MATMLRASDIVICRCGAMTLAEISAVGATAILIPSPNVTNDHQYRNARSLAEKNAAILLEERELTPKVLESIVSILAESKDQRLKYSKCIEKFAIPNATSLIADEIFKILKA